jgi:hypothetical protein
LQPALGAGKLRNGATNSPQSIVNDANWCHHRTSFGSR